MARIANKKTGKLTKQYRDPSVFHASSRRRSYRRKGTSTRRRTSYAAYTTVNDPVANAIASVIVGGGFLALLMWLLPIFVPIVVGCILLWGVDKICKSKWSLPSGKWSMPASWGWTILTGIEMIVSFFIVLFIVIEEATITALVINLIIYVGLSAWILISKHNKIMNARKLNYKSDMVQKESYSSDAYDATLSLEDDDDEEVDDDYIDAEKEAAKKLCAKLKSNVVVCSEFWDEMHLTFKYNLVTSYTSLQLNFEIKNSSGVPWYDGGGGITVKANVYDIKGNLLCIEDAYIEDSELSRNRYTDFLYFDFDDVKKAAKIEIDAYQED